MEFQVQRPPTDEWQTLTLGWNNQSILLPQMTITQNNMMVANVDIRNLRVALVNGLVRIRRNNTILRSFRFQTDNDAAMFIRVFTEMREVANRLARFQQGLPREDGFGGNGPSDGDGGQNNENGDTNFPGTSGMNGVVPSSNNTQNGTRVNGNEGNQRQARIMDFSDNVFVRCAYFNMFPQHSKAIEDNSFDSASIDSPISIIKASPGRTVKWNLSKLKKKSIKAKDWMKFFLQADAMPYSTLIGEREVAEARGDEMCVEAMRIVKSSVISSGQHKQRVILNVSIKGLRINYDKTGTVYEEFPVTKISFVTRDMTDARAFSFVAVSPEQKYKFYAIKTTQTADHAVLSIRDMFQVVFEMKTQELEEAKWKQSIAERESVKGFHIEDGVAVADLLDLESDVQCLGLGCDQLQCIPSMPEDCSNRSELFDVDLEMHCNQTDRLQRFEQQILSSVPIDSILNVQNMISIKLEMHLLGERNGNETSCEISRGYRSVKTTSIDCPKWSEPKKKNSLDDALINIYKTL
uniref:PID domain-containing protein n=1 Tax=Ditylenchus dipsaci TaxID=166011 RepID=A0A915CND7_9BILA